jgi:hypothetical protein
MHPLQLAAVRVTDMGYRATAKNHREYRDERGRLRGSTRWQSRLADGTACSKGLLRSSGIRALHRCQDPWPQDLRSESADGRALQCRRRALCVLSTAAACFRARRCPLRHRVDRRLCRTHPHATWQERLADGRRRDHRFLDEDAIDEFIITVMPTFIGEGIPLLAPKHREVALRLLGVEQFPDGVVQLHYEVLHRK